MDKHYEEFAVLLGRAVGYAITNQVEPARVVGLLEMVKPEVISIIPKEEETKNDK